MAVQDLGATKAEDRAFLAGLPVFVSLSWLETFRPSPSTADVAKELAHSLSWKVAGSGVVSAERCSSYVPHVSGEDTSIAATSAGSGPGNDAWLNAKTDTARAPKGALTIAITSELTESGSGLA